MSRMIPAVLGIAFVLAACVGSEPTIPAIAAAQAQGGGYVTRTLPDEDPGPPFYARVGVQVLHTNGWLAIPFYRAPECVPADFNLLQFYDFPGPGGPGAFACPLLMTGKVLIEPDAPLGTFPRQVTLDGSSIPIWFVSHAAFMAAAADGVVTMAELIALNPLRGTATRYHEMLQPRADDHKIVITSGGTLDDGRSFTFNLTHLGTEIKSIRIAFR